MSTINRSSTRKAFTNNRMVPGRFKHPCFFSKTNRAVFLLAVLNVLLSGCSGGSDGSGSPDPTAVGSDGSSEQLRALPFFLHDFDTLCYRLLRSIRIRARRARARRTFSSSGGVFKGAY